jgi:hypothetical protein
MRHLFFKILFFFYLLIYYPTNLRAQNNLNFLLSDDAVFSLITCSPGNEVYNIFGHSAIRLKDPKNNLDFVYNFGTFNFDTPDFVLKFIQRKLLYALSKSHYVPFESVYIAENRGVVEQKILLNNFQKQKLFETLEKNYLPQNREYLYDFFYDNCATRIRDILVLSIGKTKLPQKKSEKKFRNFLHEYIRHDVWLHFGIDLILGMEADKYCSFNNQMFLPDYMSLNLADVNLEEKPLLDTPKELLPKPALKKAEFSFKNPIVLTSTLALITFLLIVFNKKRWINQIWNGTILTILAASGIFLTFMWFGTDHIATKNNLNILWANPLYLVWITVGLIGLRQGNLKNQILFKFQYYLAVILMTFNISALFIHLFNIQEFNIAVIPLIVMLIFHFGFKIYTKTLFAK